MREGAASEAATLLALPTVATNDLEHVSAVLRVKVTGWLRYGEDKPEFSLALADGRLVVIGTTAAVLNQSRFRTKLYTFAHVNDPADEPAEQAA